MVSIEDLTPVIGGIPMHAMQAGWWGQAIVLLHGGGIDSANLSWRSSLLELGVHHRVLAFDWPGYGGSKNLAGEYTLDKMVEILAQFLDNYHIERASLVGLSMGGGAALAFALKYPQRVDRLVLVDTYGIQSKVRWHFLSYLLVKLPFVSSLSWALMRSSRRMVRWSLMGIVHDRSAITDELVEEAYQLAQHPDANVAFASFQKVEMTPRKLRTCFLPRVHVLEMPTLFIHGSEDKLVPIKDIQEAVRRMPHAALEVVPNSGHWTPREQPLIFNRLLQQFLEGGSNDS